MPRHGRQSANRGREGTIRKLKARARWTHSSGGGGDPAGRRHGPDDDHGEEEERRARLRQRRGEYGAPPAVSSRVGRRHAVYLVGPRLAKQSGTSLALLLGLVVSSKQRVARSALLH
jgi:hypothetical protein